MRIIKTNKRPDKIIVELLADGEKMGETKELTKEEVAVFKDLPKQNNGVDIVYTVQSKSRILQI